jgi:hypothetical protein
MMDGWMDVGRPLIRLCSTWGPSVILIDFSPAFKNKLKINFVM